MNSLIPMVIQHLCRQTLSSNDFDQQLELDPISQSNCRKCLPHYFEGCNFPFSSNRNKIKHLESFINSSC